MNMDGATIRPFQEKDRDAVRRICRETGLHGRPTRLFFEDEEIIPLLFVDFYLDHEPESCFVAEVSGNVVGYEVGCLDTRRQLRIMRIGIYPRVVLRILISLLGFRYRKGNTYRTLWWLLSRSWREEMKRPLDRYPAHAHYNVLEEYRSHDLGRKLSRTFRQHLLNRGVRGIHVIIREPEGDESLSAFLCRELNYRIIETRRNTVWEKTTGRIWNARLLVCDLDSIPREATDAPERH